jgi:hypothetical protein
MDSTELSEVVNLDNIVEDAISKQKRLVLTELKMNPWTKTLPYSKTYPMQSTLGMKHYGYIMDYILPEIVIKTPREIEWEVDLALSESLKSTYEENAKSEC